MPRGAAGQFSGFLCGKGFEGKSAGYGKKRHCSSWNDSLCITHEKNEKKYRDLSKDLKKGELEHPLS
jgi:hypothetical protein